MKKWICLLLLLCFTAMPVRALDITAPTVPDSAQEYMPHDTQSFAEGVVYVFQRAVGKFLPEIKEACKSCICVIFISLLISLLGSYPGNIQTTAEMAGVIAVGVLLMGTTGTLISSAKETIQELSDYGKLLLPVMTAALAAQGGTATSGALYAGTAFFDALISALLNNIIVPIVYMYLFLSIAGGALGNELLKRIRDFVKWLATWSLKTILYIFTGYISITGVVSGATDHAAMKATKLTISGAVPVVGGILSDASEAILVGAGMVKSAAGTYGLLAVMAIFIGPFIKIGVQYLLLRLSAALCSVFGNKGISGIIDDFACAMGLLLGMTGAVCLLLIISTVCFLKGVS